MRAVLQPMAIDTQTMGWPVTELQTVEQGRKDIGVRSRGTGATPWPIIITSKAGQ